MNQLKLYKVLSSFYDLLEMSYFRNKRRNPRYALVKMLSEKDNKILDVCTGTAANMMAIHKVRQDVQMTGIDLSEEMLSVARQKLQKNHIKNVKLYKMDASNMRFKDEVFDVVIISLVLHEVSEELADKLLSEAKRVLKKEGRLMVVEWEAPSNWFQSILFLPIRMLEPKGFNKFLKMNMKVYFKKHGLKLKRLQHCMYSKVLEVVKE